ncbi:MAG: DUF1571 domain-containing protein [Deltaproteobacteria bacterium]|nr:DUF1571 domain-containing protein [Candidatus Zymogenaceae bacterium]
MKRIPIFLIIMLCAAYPVCADMYSVKTDDLPLSNDVTMALSLLEDALETARGLEDYQVTLFKRERIDGILGEEERMTFKWRRPFSVYVRVEEGGDKGQEIIYVKGEYEDKMIVSPGGILGGMTLKIAPDSGIVTKNNRHIITEAGITPTLERIISIIVTDSENPSSPIRVEYHDHILFQEKPCNLIRVHENSYAYLTEIYLYRDTLLPAAFISYNEAGELIESYRYQDYLINIGLGEDDFDPDNDEYNF